MSFCNVSLACAAILLLSTGCASYRGARIYQSGTEALDRGEFEAAIQNLERAALLVPHASEIQNHLGVAYTQAGRHDAAFAAYLRAVNLDCRNSAAQHNLGVAQALELANSKRGGVHALEGDGQ